VAEIDIDGRAIEVRLIPGDATKPWLVFLHEGLGCVALWRDFPDKLARRLGSRALIYSRVGYGQSAPLSGPRTPTFMHDEALETLPKLLKALHITTPILIGHSDGASIAIIHAAHHAVSATVVMAPHVMVEPISIESIARIRQTYRTSDLPARLARHHRHVDDAFLGWADIWLSPEFATWRLDADVARITTPLLLIQGTDDEYGTLAQLDVIAAEAKGETQRVLLTNCGHSPHRDQPDAVLDAISGFVERTLDLQ
jgi:pimeloyl-ACP methyl ester carboxylesterase